jgi:site-specific DNA-methyltransferase (cytosine-N4-specific)
MRDAPFRTAGHGLFQYPAMMVPEVQGSLIDELLKVDPTVKLVFDPYIGSGTVLLESLNRNLSVWGCDINPLAILLCSVKAHDFDIDPLVDSVEATVDRASRDKGGTLIAPDSRLGSWFEPPALDQLSKLVRSIRKISALEVRRFLWVALSETVRLTSNSRTSTVKLHRMDQQAIRDREVDCLQKFRDIALSNARQMEHGRLAREQSRALASTALPTVNFWLGDTRSWQAPAPVADVIMTSPPYGDNRTTVTYGQHSWLPLAWIDAFDLPGRPAAPANPYETDRLSLGGWLRGSQSLAAKVSEKSPAFSQVFGSLPSTTNGRSRLSAFYADLDESLERISAALRPGGWLFWTLGERRINDVPVPMTQIVSELMQTRGASEVTRLTREIPLGRKRMANRNDRSETMLAETILVMRKA